MKRLALALLLAAIALPALAANGNSLLLRRGGYNPVTERFVGLKIGGLGGTSATPLSDGVDTGGTYRQQFCNGPYAQTSFKLNFPGWYMDNTGEHAFPNDVTVNASLEYPTSTNTVLTVGGLSTWTVSAGTEPTTDAIAIALPAQACFYVKTHVVVTSGGKWARGRFNQGGNGEGYATGTDQTGSTGALTGAASDYLYGPSAMIGASNRPAACITGDSIAAGASDTATSTGPLLNAIGFVERGLLNTVAWHTDTRSANRLVWWSNAHTLQFLAQPLTRCTSEIIESGTNDLYGEGLTLAALQARFLAVANVWDAAGLRVFATTMLPRVVCSPDCSTLANQTPDVTDEPIRQAYNTWLLTGPALNSGRTVKPWDIAILAQDAGTPSKWRIDLGLPSNDGVHPLVALTPTLATGVQWWAVK